ncbi:NAD-dependent epimerase/dehydratase family protein [Pseudomonas sp. NPDC007930]|uniref:SDR family oxidoreductase n=1 Tax=Pseudomonas sp. NPDC007930 TaxID=3364417 RepID=UPI0036E63721
MAEQVLVVGASGITGAALVDELLAAGHEVIGLARRSHQREGVRFVQADLTDPAAVQAALAGLKPGWVFFTTWARQATEAQNIEVNAAMVRNVLQALSGRGVRHVGLVTGLKHYLGPFEAYGQGSLPQTPFRESQGRLDVANFYYAQEDEVFAAAARDGFSWSVHRPHTVIGVAPGNAMNMATTLAVYASLCKAQGKPMVFPGSRVQWDSLTDMTDAHQLAQQLLWAATAPGAANQAFNIVNGDVFRWRWMWGRIAEWFGVQAADYPATPAPLEQQLAGSAEAWRALAGEHGLAEASIERLVSPWHTDADLGRPLEVVTDMSKSRGLGFTAYQATDEAFFRAFARLRAERLIP